MRRSRTIGQRVASTAKFGDQSSAELSPATHPTADARGQLQRILQSDTFKSAAGLRTLLTFVIEETLAGRRDHLKEYCLGTMALGRGGSFDPKIDPIVRVQMGRLRQRLQHYYATQGKLDPIAIGFVKGTYVPTIHDHRRDADGDEHADPAGADGGFTADDVNIRARYLLGQRNVARVREAAALVDALLQKTPSFAPAYVTVAECYRQYTVLEMMPPAEAVPKMKAACERALTLNPCSAEAHAALAGVLAWGWNFAAAEREYELAVDNGGQSAFTCQRYAVHLAATQRFAEAVDYANRACDLDPLSAACEHTRGVVHYWRHDFARALESARNALVIAPQFGLGHHLLGFMYLHAHEYGPATEALAQATALSGASTFDVGYQAYGFACAGNDVKAREILKNLFAAAQHQYVAPLSIAHCYLGLGVFDQALDWIHRAYTPGMGQWPYYLAAPFYEPLWRNDRFQSILERIGLSRPAAPAAVR